MGCHLTNNINLGIYEYRSTTEELNSPVYVGASPELLLYSKLRYHLRNLCFPELTQSSGIIHSNATGCLTLRDINSKKCATGNQSGKCVWQQYIITTLLLKFVELQSAPLIEYSYTTSTTMSTSLRSIGCKITYSLL